MRKKDDDLDERLVGFGFYDIMVQFAALMVMLFALVMILPHNKNAGEVAMSGRICAELYWDNNRDVDLDIWGLAPEEVNPIYYHNMHSAKMDLFRDVTGFRGNPEHINMEIMCAHALYPGQYTFNVIYFGRTELITSPVPIDGTMVIRIKKADGTETILKRKVTFEHEKDQHTMFDFRVDEFGIVQNSINFEEKRL